MPGIYGGMMPWVRPVCRIRTLVTKPTCPETQHNHQVNVILEDIVDCREGVHQVHHRSGKEAHGHMEICRSRQLPCPRAKVRGARGPSSHSNECNTELSREIFMPRKDGA